MLSELEIAESIRGFIAKNFLFRSGVDAIGDNDSLLEQGVIDSMGVLELITFLEERFGVRIADDEMVPENLDSIGRITAFVNGKLQSPAAAAGAVHAG